MIEKHKNYTSAELIELLGKDWRKKLNLDNHIYVSPKTIVNTINDFDDETKQIYIGIYNLIKEKNPKQDIKVWATGSRVKGTWKTQEEAESILNINPKARVKYSDYDFITDANNIPNTQEFFEKLGVKVDMAGGEGHKVLIEV